MSRQPDGAGKGDLSRPLGVPMETFDNNWDAIFKKKPVDQPSVEEIGKQLEENDRARRTD
jgi:hypothetical protein